MAKPGRKGKISIPMNSVITYQPKEWVSDDGHEYSYREYNYRELPPDHPDRVQIEQLLAGLKPKKKEHVISTNTGDRIKQKRRDETCMPSITVNQV